MSFFFQLHRNAKFGEALEEQWWTGRTAPCTSARADELRQRRHIPWLDDVNRSARSFLQEVHTYVHELPEILMFAAICVSEASAKIVFSIYSVLWGMTRSQRVATSFRENLNGLFPAVSMPMEAIKYTCWSACWTYRHGSSLEIAAPKNMIFQIYMHALKFDARWRFKLFWVLSVCIVKNRKGNMQLDEAISDPLILRNFGRLFLACIKADFCN